MNALLKAGLFTLALIGLHTSLATTASASEAGLLKYAVEQNAASNVTIKPIIVADRRRHHRRHKHNRGGRVAAGIAVGIAGLIISEAIRDSHRGRGYYYDDDYYYDDYPGRYQCRKWIRRCDRGNRQACRKWDRRCR
jgi:hypothetical protein